MTYHVVYSNAHRQAVKTLLEKSKALGLLSGLKRTLLNLHERMTNSPIESGESRYAMNYVKLTVYDAATTDMAVRYAVDEEGKNVFVMKFTFFGKHPYPAEFDEILNPKHT